MKVLVPLILTAGCIVLGYMANDHYSQSAEAKRVSLGESVKVETIVREHYEGYEPVSDKVMNLPSFKDTFGFELNRHMKKFNDDYLGAIMIPSIGVNDAVFGGEGEYYLHNDYRKLKNEVGEIYLDDRTGTELTGNGALLNGHAVPNGSKFGNFKKLLNVEEAPSVYVWDADKQSVAHYEIMFVSLIDGNNSGVIMEFESPEEQLIYYQRLHDTAIKKWSRPTGLDEFLVMNSCAYIIDNGHYVAFARKVGVYE